MDVLVPRDEPDGVVLTNPHSLVADATVLSRGLSEGRRQAARLAVGDHPAFQTDLAINFIPWPQSASGDDLAVCVALQSSPTKEVVATVAAELLTARQISALQLVEGAASAGWVCARWPGLTASLSRVVGPTETVPWEEVSGTDLVSRALGMAGRGRTPFHVPAAYGDLPVRRQGPTLMQWAARKAGSRLPFSVERTLKKLDALSIPVGGRGGEDAPDSGAPQMHETDGGMNSGGTATGIPYPEWDELAGEYRRDFVTVHESRTRPQRRNDSRSPRPPGHNLDAFFAEPIDRHWTGRLADGCDVDIDAVVDSRVAALSGDAPSERLYRDRIRVDRDVACAVLIDTSGSLAQADLLKREIACAEALVEAMIRSGEAFAVFAFSGDTRHHVAVDVLHDFGDAAVSRPTDARLKPQGYTRLGAAIRHVTARLERVPSTRKVLLLLSDAVPCDEGYEGPYAYADVAKAVLEADEAGVSLMILGVGESDDDEGLPRPLKERIRRVSTVDDLAPALGEVHARLAGGGS
jgi:nitric oxide reductase NorD protein